MGHRLEFAELDGEAVAFRGGELELGLHIRELVLEVGTFIGEEFDLTVFFPDGAVEEVGLLVELVSGGFELELLLFNLLLQLSAEPHEVVHLGGEVGAFGTEGVDEAAGFIAE